jgi:hypothetical protein
LILVKSIFFSGGGIALWYSAIFPEQVEKLVTIDLISFGSLSLQKHVKASRSGSSSFPSLYEKRGHLLGMIRNRVADADPYYFWKLYPDPH